MTHDTLWIIAILATIAGLAFSIAPVVPGDLFVPFGAVLICLADSWSRAPMWFWIAQGVLVAMYTVIDHLVQARGIARRGGSRRAVIGGVIGMMLGGLVLAPVLGPFALFVGPPLGAVAGTIIGELDARKRGRTTSEASLTTLGVVSMISYLISTAMKVGIVACQAVLLVLVVVLQ